MLDETLLYLIDETSESGNRWSHTDRLQRYKHHLSHLETSSKLSLLQELLCVRSPQPPLPQRILKSIDSILLRTREHRTLTVATSIAPSRTIKRDDGQDINICLWRGDITSLTAITAITNAANGQMLGCFQPTHRCIDNIIHSQAGPRLRAECYQLMQIGERELEAGEALVSRGHALPSPYVVHTVGPQLRRGASPTELERRQLARCYEGVLEALEALPVEDGSKSIALCCISTGLFAFPAKEAAEIAVSSVFSWLDSHPATTITHVIFNTFTELDTEIYTKLLSSSFIDPTTHGEIPKSTRLLSSLEVAQDWLNSADAVLVTAGAGFSAAEGLDYHSKTLFKEHFPAFLKYGLGSLYSVFGFDGWESEEHRWGYYFTHLNMVAQWPKTATYQTVLSWLARFGPDAHVRTSNADGLFAQNGWSGEQLSTPQGGYAFLQCLDNCRPEATIPSAPLVADAVPFIDKDTQTLTDPAKVPRCRFCGAKMSICVRAGSWFNDRPFRQGEATWKAWRSRIIREKKKLVILELGVGMNTPGVLRWPNEDFVTEGDGLVKLVRIGLGPEAVVPWDQEEEKLSTYIQGDVKEILPVLLGEATL
ncbi:hypothetical protein ACJ41O_014377 [Fusarium nematophilum]